MTIPYLAAVPSKPAVVQSGLLFSWDTEDGYPQVRTGQTLTYTSSDTGNRKRWSVGADGRGHFHAMDAPRLQHRYDAASGLWLPVGMLLEGVRTNEFTFGWDLSNAAWVKVKTTVATDSPRSILPVSERTVGYKLRESDTTSSEHLVRRTLSGLTDSTRQGVLWLAKAAERGFCFLKTIDKGGTLRRSWVNLSTGAVGTKNSGHEVATERLDDGWWLCLASFASSTGATTPEAAVGIATADNTHTYVGVVNSGIYVGGIQVEKDKGFPSTPIVDTPGSAPSRDVDVLTSTFDAPVQDMTIYVKLPRPPWIAWPSLGISPYILKVSTANPRLYIVFAGAVIAFALLDSVGNLVQTAPAIPAGDFEFAMQIRNLLTGGSVAADVNDGNGMSGFSAANPPISAWGNSTVQIGTDGGTQQLFGALGAVRIASGLRTLAQMKGYR